MVSPVFCGDVFYDLAAAFVAEIYIEIRHTDPFRVQKPFEKQSVADRIHPRYTEKICAKAAHAAPSPGADGYRTRTGIIYEIPDNKVIIVETHSADDRKLVFHPLAVCRLIRDRSAAQKRVEPVRAQLFQVRIGIVRRGNAVSGQVHRFEIEVEIALVGYADGVFRRLRDIRKQRFHFG